MDWKAVRRTKNDRIKVITPTTMKNNMIIFEAVCVDAMRATVSVVDVISSLMNPFKAFTTPSRS